LLYIILVGIFLAVQMIKIFLRKEEKMVALSVGKKRELGALSSMLAKTVWAVGLVAILVSCGRGGYSYTVRGAVRGLAGSGLVLQNNGGADLSISANGVFTFLKAVPNGTAYAVTVKTQPSVLSQTCTVYNGSGTISNAPVSNVVVSCVTPPHSVTVDPRLPGPGKFAYAVNAASNTISVYTINTTTGALTTGTAMAAGTTPFSVTVDPLGRFAYAANYNSNTISVYKISDQTTGALTAGTAVAAGTNPFSVTVDPSGKFAYAANVGDNTISVYTIDQTTGALTTGTAVAAGTNPYSVTVDPSGQFAYVANLGDNTISVYTIDPLSGALTAGTAVATGANPFSLTVYPSIPPGPGQFAYAANYNSNTISVYTIDPLSGALTPGTAVATGTNPSSVTVDPSGQFAYVVNVGDSTISVYTIDPLSGGALTPSLFTPTVAAGTNPSSVTVDPLGRFAYAANYNSNNISAYKIESTGALTAIAGSPFAAGTNPASITVEPSGKFAYAENVGANTISVYKIEITGALTAGTAVPIQ
jgi:3-carboxymuconate cyclase